MLKTATVKELKDFLADLPDDMEIYLASTLLRPLENKRVDILADTIKQTGTMSVAVESAWTHHNVDKSTIRKAVILSQPL